MPRALRLAAIVGVSTLVVCGLALPAQAVPSGPAVGRAAARELAAPAGEGELTAVLGLAQTPQARAALHALALTRLSPGSGSQRRAEVAALAPRSSARDAVLTWAASHGLRVTHADPWSVTVVGPAGTVAPLFGTTAALRTSHVDHAKHLAVTATPLVPAELLTDVATVSGLDDSPLLHPQSVPGGHTTATLRSTYDVTAPSSTGSGVTVGTLDFASWDPNDLTTYAGAAGIPIAPGQITEVPVDNPGAIDTPGTDGGDFEVAMDSEAILATAPAAKQRLYFAPNTGAGSIDAVNQMATDAQAGLLQVASTSWGSCEPQTPGSYATQLGQAIDRLLAAGATLYAASGDAGRYDCSSSGAPDNTVAVDFPSSWPNVVAAGGTHARYDLTGAETAWGSVSATPGSAYAGDGSGGGVSTMFARPSWQSGLSPAGSFRLVPDVSSVADPSTGLGTYVGTAGGWLLGGGTSLAAPTWAGFTAAALSAAGRTTGLGNVLPALYAHPGDFRDVTSGSNGFAAGAGYDLVTGLGSPDWNLLGHDITGAPVSGVPSTVTAPGFTAAPYTRTGSVAVAFSDPTDGSGSYSQYAAGESPAPTCPDATAKPGSFAAPLASATNGTHTITGVAVDNLGGCHTVTTTTFEDTVAPAASAAAALYTGWDNRVRLTWGGHDSGSGVSRYSIVLRRLDGSSVLSATTTGTGTVATLAGGTTYRLYVRAIDRAGNASGYAVASVSVPLDDSRLRFAGTWVHERVSHDFASTDSRSSSRGAGASVSFTGHALRLGLLRSAAGGYLDVYVDGVRRLRLDSYAAATQYRQQVLVASFTRAGAHTVRFVVVGGHRSGSRGSNVALDSVTITP